MTYKEAFWPRKNVSLIKKKFKLRTAYDLWDLIFIFQVLDIKIKILMHF